MSDREHRICGAVALSILSVVATYAVWRSRAVVVYPDAHNTVADAARLVWMMPFSLAGLSWRAWAWRDYGEKALGRGTRNLRWNESPLFEYLLYYPFLLAIGNTLAFAALHGLLGLDDWLFYPVSAIVALALAKAPGRWEKLLGFAGL